jgi:hypothetical protein
MGSQNVMKSLEECAFVKQSATDNFPVVIADTDLSRLSVLARAENIFATFLCKIFDSTPIPRLPENSIDPSAITVDRTNWTRPMSAMSNALFSFNPNLEAQWRYLSWLALSSSYENESGEVLPINNPAEFLACHLRRMMHQCRPFLADPDTKSVFRDAIRPLMVRAFNLWSETFSSEDRISAKMPPTSEGDGVHPYVDPEYEDAALVTSDVKRSSDNISYLTLWPEITMSETPDPNDRCYNEIRVLYPGKILASSSMAAIAARQEFEKHTEVQRAAPSRRISHARRYSSSSTNTATGTNGTFEKFPLQSPRGFGGRGGPGSSYGEAGKALQSGTMPGEFDGGVGLRADSSEGKK